MVSFKSSAWRGRYGIGNIIVCLVPPCHPRFPRAGIKVVPQFWGTIATLTYSCSCGQYVRYMSASDVCRLRLVQRYQNVRLDDPVLPVVSLQQ